MSRKKAAREQLGSEVNKSYDAGSKIIKNRSELAQAILAHCPLAKLGATRISATAESI